MQNDEEGEDCVPQPPQTGWTGKISIVTGGNPNALALRFPYFQDKDGIVHATPTEVVATKQAVLELMLAIQEAQRLFGLSTEGGQVQLVRADD